MMDPRLGTAFYDANGDYWIFDFGTVCYQNQTQRNLTLKADQTFAWLDRNFRLTEAMKTQLQYDRLNLSNTINTTNTKMKHTLFLIYAIYNARPTTDATGTDTTPKPSLVVAPEYILAAGSDAAKAILSRKIPDDMMDKLEFIDSIVKAM